jgi:predicted RNA binding protein YcfA (HicA-like mRNA interferase family)
MAPAKPSLKAKPTGPTLPKTLEKMKANPKADWKMSDLEAVAKRIGLEVRKPGGSHHTFSSSKLVGHLTVPKKKPIKPPYIRNFVGMCEAHLDLVEQEQANEKS